MRRVSLLLLVIVALATLSIPAWAEDAEVDPEVLFIGTGIGTPCQNGGCFVYGTEVNGVGPTTISIHFNGAGHPPLPNPILLIIGIPNGNGSAPASATVSDGTNTIGSGVLGGPNTYGGVWNTVTGFAGTLDPGEDAYGVASLNGSPSQSFTNWSAAEAAVNGITATFFDIYVYTLTLNAGESFAGGDTIDVIFSSALPFATFIIANGCSDFSQPVQNGPQAGNCQTGNTYATPFTQSGLSDGHEIPEPGTMALFGSGLLGLAGVLRRRLG